MQKKKATKSKRTGTRARRWRLVIAISLASSLVIAAGAFAQWAGIASLGQKLGKEKSGEASSQSFSPGALSIDM